MKTLPRLTLAFAMFAASLGLAPLAANAAPFAPAAGPVLGQAAAAPVENVAWVCGPYRCWHRPGPAFWRPRPYYAPGPYFYGRPYYRPHWGYHHGW